MHNNTSNPKIHVFWNPGLALRLVNSYDIAL